MFFFLQQNIQIIYENEVNMTCCKKKENTRIILHEWLGGGSFSYVSDGR